MRFDRNSNPRGIGKYALINLRTNAVEWGYVGAPDEFFVIKLKDVNAEAALRAYADEADKTDPEWAAEVRDMVERRVKNNLSRGSQTDDYPHPIRRAGESGRAHKGE